MTKGQITIQKARPKIKKVSSQERSVLAGDLIVMNGYGVSRSRLKQRFAEGDIRHMRLSTFFFFFVRKPQKPFWCIGLPLKNSTPISNTTSHTN